MLHHHFPHGHHQNRGCAMTTDAIDLCTVEPLPFTRSTHPLSCIAECADDPFLQAALQLLVTIDEPHDDDATWSQLPAIRIPVENTLMEDEGLITPDDQRVSFASHPISVSPGASRKRLRVDTLTSDKGLVSAIDHDEDDGQFQKRLLTNTRRDAVASLREEARALETTLKGLHLRQSRPKTALSDDPDALVKSYAENIQLKRAIEEQDAKIKTLRRAVSLRENSHVGGEATSTTAGAHAVSLA